MKDKFKAIWLSHSSISDYLKCARLYYLRNVYKDPLTNHKITIVSPALSRGQAVHNVIESLSIKPQEERFKEDLIQKLEEEWIKVSGEKGGFITQAQEIEYKQQAISMIERIIKNPGPLLEKAVKIPGELPFFWLSEEENLILSGKIDWLIYKEETDSVHILDFKTGKTNEPEDSLQLPIYELLVSNTQKRDIDGASYWYLERDDSPTPVSLVGLSEAYEKIITIGRRIKLARQLGVFTCKEGQQGCKHCAKLESVRLGKGKKVGLSQYKQDLYILD